MPEVTGGASPLTPVAADLPLSAFLSQMLVAFTVECDNEFEHLMPHRTTRHGRTPGAGRQAPWLISLAMWSTCLRFVPEAGIRAGELARQARVSDANMRMMLTRMADWWGYLTVDAAAPATGGKRFWSAQLIRPTLAGQRAQAVRAPVADLVEDRWRERLGIETVDRLRRHLWAVVSRLDVVLPDYLPVGTPRLEARQVAPAAPATSVGIALSALLSQVLLAFALAVEGETGLPLALSANVLRILTAAGVRVRNLPALTGVAPMGVDNALSQLQERRLLLVGPDPAGSRYKVAQLTPLGGQAQQQYEPAVAARERLWVSAYSTETVQALRAVLEALVGEPTAAHSPLFSALCR
jgi:DNA-binding MarR family transcriptional regulator